MKQLSKSMCQCILTFCLLACPLSSNADEVVLQDGSNDDEVKLGDYNCSAYRAGASSNFQLQDQTITAGQLWTFFDEQGLDSVESLVICVDVDRLPADQQLGLNAMDLLIGDQSGSQKKCHYTMGNNSFVLPARKTRAYTAECRFEVDLGYDFMERYSSSSTDAVKLNVDLDDSAASSPVFFIEGKRSLFTVPNMLMLSVFCLFWVAAFWMLKRFTLPSAKTTPVRARPVLTLPKVPAKVASESVV